MRTPASHRARSHRELARTLALAARGTFIADDGRAAAQRFENDVRERV